MRRFLTRLTIRIAIAFCLLVGAIRLSGRLIPYPMHEIVQQFECEPQPCWHNIQIGVTSVAEARRILSGDPTLRVVDAWSSDDLLCWAWTNEWQSLDMIDACYSAHPNSSTPLYMDFQQHPLLRLGDVAPFMGGFLLSSVNCAAAMPRGVINNGKMRAHGIDARSYERIVVTLYVSREAVATPSPSAGSGFGAWDVVTNGCP